MTVRKGDKAPTFALPAKPGEMVDLNQHIGKERVVLLFFPLAFSSVCTEEMCHFRDNWSQWDNLGAKVFGISVDSPFVTDKFRQEMKIPFPILSDFNKDVAQKYDAMHDDLLGLKGVAKRSAFVIDVNGTISYAWVSDDPRQQVRFDEVRAALESGVPA